jgi:hypothetical protein
MFEILGKKKRIYAQLPVRHKYSPGLSSTTAKLDKDKRSVG